MCEHRSPMARYMLLDGTLEINNDRKGRLDDVFGRGVGLVRLERMSETTFWMAVYNPKTETEERVVIWINALKDEHGEVHLDVRMEEELLDKSPK
jgi:hypothetical protein